MNAQATYGTSGSKLGKFALVGGLHLAFGLAMLNMKAHYTAPAAAALEVFVPDISKPVDPPEPPLPTTFEKPDLPTIPIPFVKTTVATDDTIKAEASDKPVPPPARAEVAGPETIVKSAVEPARETRSSSDALTMASNCVLPNYPASSARNGEEGTVTLALLIGTDGMVNSSKVTRSSGYRELDRAAINALSMCKFKPAMTNGVPEAGWGRIAYVWRLD